MNNFHVLFWIKVHFLLTTNFKCFLEWNSSASDGLNKFFKITILNNNWRELCIFASHNIHYPHNSTFLHNK